MCSRPAKCFKLSMLCMIFLSILMTNSLVETKKTASSKRIQKTKESSTKAGGFFSNLKSTFTKTAKSYANKLKKDITTGEIIDTVTGKSPINLNMGKLPGSIKDLKDFALNLVPSGMKDVANTFMGFAGESFEDSPKEEEQIVIVEDPEAMKALSEGFAQMNASLNELENQIDQVKNYASMIVTEFSKHKARFDYEKNVAMPLQTLSNAQRRLLILMNRDHLKFFKESCRSATEDPESILEWLHFRIVRDKIDPNLIKTNVDGTSYDELMTWITAVTADAIKAAALNQACLGTQRFSDDTINEAIEKTSQEINEILDKLQKHHDERVLQLLEKEIDQLAKNEFATASNTLAQKFHTALKDQFPFAHWFVAVYKKDLVVNYMSTTARSVHSGYGGLAKDKGNIYAIWCVEETGPFRQSESANKMLLEKAKTEFLDLKDACVATAKEDIKDVNKFLSMNSPAFNQAGNAFIYYAEDKKDKFFSYAGPPSIAECTRDMPDACGPNFRVILTP